MPGQPQISFARLESGWGVRVQQDLNQSRSFAGQEVRVNKRDGSSTLVQLGHQIDQWNGGRTRIYAIAGGGQGPRQNGSPREPGTERPPQGPTPEEPRPQFRTVRSRDDEGRQQAAPAVATPVNPEVTVSLKAEDAQLVQQVLDQAGEERAEFGTEREAERLYELAGQFRVSTDQELLDLYGRPS